MKSYRILTVLCLLFYISSCIEGEQGPEGPQGEIGQQGIPGTDGNMLRHGIKPPEDTEGKEGDFFIDTENSNLYGPKTSSGWGAPVDLSGEQGEAGSDGQDGTRIYSGSMSPPPAIGDLGDFYFQTSTAILFGPKRTTGWGSGVNLKGPKGDPGTANVIASDWRSFNIYARSSIKITVAAYLPSEVLSRLLATTESKSLYDFVNSQNGTLLVYHRNPENGLFSLPSFRPMGSWQIKSSIYWTLDGTSGWENRILIEVDNMSDGQYTFASNRLVFGTDNPEFRFVMIPQGFLNASIRGRYGDDLSNLSYEEAISLFEQE